MAYWSAASALSVQENRAAPAGLLRISCKDREQSPGFLPLAVES
jgi:hypothetical protein